MSGTSMDAIDAALVHFRPDALEMIEYDQFPLGDPIRSDIRRLCADSSDTEINRYHTMLGTLFSEAAARVIRKAGVETAEIIAIGSHGQTVLHLPEAIPPRTLQIGDAAIIAANTGITTVADFRRADMEAGGQGAPLTPALHADQFRSRAVNRCILNLGGIANITVLPAGRHTMVTGFDTGPANCLLDDWHRRHNNTNMDQDGLWASQGTADGELLARLLADPYFFRAAPKSTGRDYFNLAWLDQNLSDLQRQIAPVDVQATLLQLTVCSIVNTILNLPTRIEEIYICGGGVHNPALVSGLSGQLPQIQVASTQALGMNPDAVEAITFAWLAKQRLEGKPGNLPSVTGARKAVLLGTIYEPGKTRNAD
jgi:anhydro-N-acetylmuramic acid kinase